MTDTYSSEEPQRPEALFPGAAEFLQQDRRNAQAVAMSSLDDDPEEASRAMELSKATGVPAPVVHGDLENFEQQHKAQLTSQLINSNDYLREYVNSHPMAASVSNDDYGNLDNYSEALGKLSVKSILGKTIEAAKEGFGEGPMGEWLGADFAQQHPASWVAWSLLGAPIEIPGRLFNAAVMGTSVAIAESAHQLGLSDAWTDRMLRDLVIGGNMLGTHLMMKPGEAPPPELQKLAKQAQKAGEVAQAIEPWLKAGEEPPVGIHPEIDKIKIEQAKLDAKNLDDALKGAEATATRERSPELAAAFGRQHTEGTIGISADAVRKLYGDKEPTAEDGILGWVPDIVQQLHTAEEVGGDVEVPIADWLAKVDPEVHKSLRDDIRFREGGVTINEASDIQDALASKIEEPEAIKSAAIELKDGRIIEGVNHGDALEHLRTLLGKEDVADEITDRGTGGFTTSKGRYVDRFEAGEIAKEAQQVKRGHVIPEMGLFTENLEQGSYSEPGELGGGLGWLSKALRDSAGLEPLAAKMGEVGLERTKTVEGKRENLHSFNLMDQGGKSIGDLEIAEREGGKSLRIDWIGGEGLNEKGGVENVLGPRAIRSLLRNLREEFPKAETVFGRRVSGAHAKAREREVARLGDVAEEDLPDFTEVKLPLRPKAGVTEADIHEGLAAMLGQKGGEVKGESIIPPDAKPGEPLQAGGFEYTVTSVFSGKDALKNINIDDLEGPAKILGKFFRTHLAKLAGDEKIYVIPDDELQHLSEQVMGLEKGGRTGGIYITKKTGEHFITLPESVANGSMGPGEATHKVLHELTHAATVRAMKESKELRNHVLGMMDETHEFLQEADPGARKAFNYAFENEYEFMAEAYSNKDFRKVLTALPMSDELAAQLKIGKGKWTVWDGIRKIVKDVVERLIGVEMPATILDGVLQIGRLIEEGEYKKDSTKVAQAVKSLGSEGPKAKLLDLYHGTTKEFDERLSTDFASNKYEKAVFLTDNPEVSDAYAEGEGGHVYRVRVDPNDLYKPTQSELESFINKGDFVQLALDKATELGKKGVHFELGGDNVYAINKPEAIRYKYAEGLAAEAPKLPKGLEEKDRDLYSIAINSGMTQAQARTYIKLLNREADEDVAFQEKKAQAQAQLEQTKTWKENYVKVKAEVTENLSQRPDIMADNALRVKGVKLDPEYLTPEQRNALPKQYLAKGGYNPDNLAGYFGYTSGTGMVDHLTQLAKVRGEMEPREFFNTLVRRETDRQMATKYGDLEENILAEAKEHVLSPTTMDRLHEEVLFLGAKAGLGKVAPPKPGFVRMYHGGVKYEGGARWLTPSEEYAREGYSDKGEGSRFVHYVDIPEDSPHLKKSFEDEDTYQKASYVSFEAPEEIAKGLKPLEKGEDVGLPMSKGDLRAWVKEQVAGSPLSWMKSDKFLAAAGRAGQQAELVKRTGGKNSPTEAFKAKQLQEKALLMAKEAMKIEKEKGQFDQRAKSYAAREKEGLPPEYLNWIHDILTRTGNQIKRSVQDLAGEIGEKPDKTLQAFVDSKRDLGNDLYMADFLFDPNFRKGMDSLNVDEFRAINDSIKSLIKVGRDEQKLYKAGEAFDRGIIMGKLVDGIKTVGPEIKRSDIPEGVITHNLKTYLAASLSLETIFNRFDRNNPRGVFNQFIVRNYVEGINGLAASTRRYARYIKQELSPIKDMYKKVENDLFRHPNTDEPLPMSRLNVLAVLQNVGNKSNFDGLLRGYGLDPAADGPHVMQWLFDNTTKEDWDRAQALGRIFGRATKENDMMRRELSGVAPEKLDLWTINTPYGDYEGWYHKRTYDRSLPQSSQKLAGPGVLAYPMFTQALPGAGFTKSRTGYVGPYLLDFSAVASSLHEILHDTHMRPVLVELNKTFRDKDFKQAMTDHMGKIYTDLLDPWLKSVAKVDGTSDAVDHVATQTLEFFRQNMISYLVGANPATLAKHTFTAAMNSITEVGPKNYLKWQMNLLGKNPETGESNWRFAINLSEELQQRHKNYLETIKGADERVFGNIASADWKSTLSAFDDRTLGEGLKATGQLAKGKYLGLREAMMWVEAGPLAFGDLASAVPTWLAQYEKSSREVDHGTAVFEADRAVRRAHGSTAITNRPKIMRGGALAQSFASFYGFFSHIMQRSYEMAWAAKGALKGDPYYTEGEAVELRKNVGYSTTDLVNPKDKESKAYKTGLAMIPVLVTGLVSYSLMPAFIEEEVSPQPSDPKESSIWHWTKAWARGESSKWIGIRDFMHSVIEGGDIGGGLFGTGGKSILNTLRDINAPQSLGNRQKQQKFIKDINAVFSALTGLSNASVPRMGVFGYNWDSNQERITQPMWPPWAGGTRQVWRGVTTGTAKERRR